MTLLYVIGGDTGPLKIGITVSLNTRLSTLQCSTHVRLKVYCSWEHKEAGKIERAVHKELHHCRLAGEWFDTDFETIRGVVERIMSSRAYRRKQKKAPHESIVERYIFVGEEYHGPAIAYDKNVCPSSKTIAYVAPHQTTKTDAQLAWAREHGAKSESIFADRYNVLGDEWHNAYRYVRPGDTLLVHSSDLLGDAELAPKILLNLSRRGIRVILSEMKAA